MRSIFVAQNHPIEGFSKELAIENALDRDLIQSTSLMSGFTSPLSREKAAHLTTKLLSSIHYKPAKVYPSHSYEDQNVISPDHVASIYYLQQNGIMGSSTGGQFNPTKNLTLEEGLSIANQLYKLYSASPYSYINKLKKSLLQPNF